MFSDRKFIDLDGIRTSYFETGTGENVVLVHGGHFGIHMSSSIAWRALFPLLAEQFHVFAVDKLGMGFTDNPQSDDDYTMEATIEHITGFIKSRGIEKVHLVGQSRGALPVARIAIDHPELVRSLTIFNSNTLAPGDPIPKVPDIPSVFVQGGPPLNEVFIRERLFSMLHKQENISEDMIEEMVTAHLEVALLPKTRQVAERFNLLRARFVEQNSALVKERPGLAKNSGTGWWIYQAKDKALALIEAGRLIAPTLIIWGASDGGAEVRLGMELFELVSRSVNRTQFHLFDHCGHHPFVEYSREVADLMVSFIKNLPD